MFLKQFYNKHLSQYSYLIGCQKTGESLIIDPIRDLSEYEFIAKEEGLKLTHAAETHIHADFFSGIREAQKKGLEIYVSKHGQAGLSYENMPNGTNYVGERDIIHVGNVKIDILHTPGHTPESVSFLLTDIGGGSKVPMGLFTGDFIFVGDVGRPDLLEKAASVEGATEAGAKKMYESIQKMKDLPNSLQIWPGHGAGSPCGKSLGAIPISTLGYERQNNWAFNTPNEAEFIQALTQDQPVPPNHFKEMKQLNQKGGNDFKPYTVSNNDSNYEKYDIRNKEDYHKGHIFGSINIPYNKNFINQIGFFLNYDEPLTLISDDEQEVQEAIHTLQLIGYDKVNGYVTPKNEVKTKEIASEDIKGNETQILDVRNDDEWHNGHIEKAIHIPHSDLQEAKVNLNKTEPVYVHCQSGVRSSIAVGLLEQQGFNNVINIKTGYKDIKPEAKNESY